jgi:hypothetical protein
MIEMALLAVASVGLRTAADAPKAPSSDVVFACQFFRNDSEAQDGVVGFVDIRVLKRADGTWTLERNDEPLVTATPFLAYFGSVGRSLGLRWQDKRGKVRTAFLSYLDVVLPAGKEYFWPSFDRPSLWRTPGYGCESQSMDQAGAGA